MEIKVLVENIAGINDSIIQAHGLSLYITTAHHCLLMDTGPSDLIVHNAKQLSVDLEKIDTIILSHGHYDHANGIFAVIRNNPNIRIFMQKDATLDYYGRNIENDGWHYIGIEPALKNLKQITYVNESLIIDNELTLFSGVTGRQYWPSSNKRLGKHQNGQYIQDDFRHEQYLVIHDVDKTVLLSGCAHNGIVNILQRYYSLFGNIPDVVISGFHMMKTEEYTKQELNVIDCTAEALLTYPCKFYTCHCTGWPAYERMKRIMNNQLQYLHCGDTLNV